MAQGLRIALIALATLILSGIAAVRAQENAVSSAEPWPQSALVLFGAHWCAPCTAELAALPAIVAASRTHMPMLAWVDRNPPHATGVPAIPPTRAQALFKAVLPIGGGLPLAVMTDRDGARCALHKGPIDAADVVAMERACTAPS